MELIKRLRSALTKPREGLGWSIAGGLIGAGIGLLVAMLYIHAQGWR